MDRAKTIKMRELVNQTSRRFEQYWNKQYDYMKHELS